MSLPESATGSRAADIFYISCMTQTNHPRYKPKEINGRQTKAMFVLWSLDTIVKYWKCTLHTAQV